MQLRKCPACHDLVNGDSGVCPRCGVRFRAAIIRRVVLWAASGMLTRWVVSQFALHRWRRINPSNETDVASARRLNDNRLSMVDKAREAASAKMSEIEPRWPALIAVLAYGGLFAALP